MISKADKHMRNLLIKFICSCFIAFFSQGLSAQKTQEEDYANGKTKKPKPTVPFREKLVFGGNLGGYFGARSYVQLNPMVGYKTTDWWVNGVGFNYIYASNGSVRQNVYGPSIWTRAYIRHTFILHSELEYLKVNAKSPFGEFHADVPVWLVGAGIQTSGSGIGISAMVLYDVIQDKNSPYSTPIIRIGGLIGF
jgi:hypothetical protein